MKTFGKWVCKIEKGIGGALLLLMMGLVFFATVGRYTGLYNMAWSDEASRYCMIWSVFIVAGLSAQRGQMFSIDVVSEKLPLKDGFLMNELLDAMSGRVLAAATLSGLYPAPEE